MSVQAPAAQPTQQRWLSGTLWAVKNCTPFFYSQADDKDCGVSWSWTSQISHLMTQVVPNEARGTVSIFVRDTLTDKTIHLWSSKINITGATWRNRLRQAVGEAFILTQYRPKCPTCRAETELRELSPESDQFFGCIRREDCAGLIRLVDHDIERKEAVSVSARTA